MQLPPDPSWCARINARPAAPPDPAPSPPEPPRSPTAVPASVVTGNPYRKVEPPSTHECELCGTVMYDHNCKIVCPNCGYKRDCSDP